MLPASREFGPRPPATIRQSSPDDSGGPPHPADIAQSQLFDAMLRGEIDELKSLAAKAERMWRRRIDRSGDSDDQPPEGLLRVRGRIAEAERMLVELRRRFPYDGDSLRVIRNTPPGRVGVAEIR